MEVGLNKLTCILNKPKVYKISGWGVENMDKITRTPKNNKRTNV